MIKLFPTILQLFCLVLFQSCKSQVDVSFQSRSSKSNDSDLNSSLKSLSLGTLNLTSNDFFQTVNISIPFSGDENSNSSISLFYCSIKKEPGCNPLNGESISLTKVGSQLIGTINISLSVELTSGDLMKYQLVSLDIDGINGGSATQGFILIPHNQNSPRGIRNFSDMASSTGGQVNLNAAGVEEFGVSALDSEGNLYLAGATSSSLGEISGGFDAVIIKLLPSGELDQSFANEGIFQLGIVNSKSSPYDMISSMTLDNNGFLYASGITYGSLGGTNGGLEDIFILKLNTSNGTLDLSFGNGDGNDNDGIVQINNLNSNDSSSTDFPSSLILDPNTHQSLYLTGVTQSSLGGLNAGDMDGFVLKLNPETGILNSDFGLGDGSDNDGIVQLNANNTSGANLKESISDILCDSNGNLYLFGSTLSNMGATNLGGQNGIIIKLNSLTGLLDSQFGDSDGTNDDGVLQINSNNSMDDSDTDDLISATFDTSENLFVVGSTNSDLGGTNGGFGDGIVLKVNSASGQLDTTFGNGDGNDNDGIVQINSSATGDESFSAITIDSSNQVFLGGYTTGILGSASTAYISSIVVKLDGSTGILNTAFGNGDGNDNDGVVKVNPLNPGFMERLDFFKTLTLDNSGNLYVSGTTTGAIGGDFAGAQDLFVAKINSSSGNLDLDYGVNDGIDNDGIFQLNFGNRPSIGVGGMITAIVSDDDGNLYVAGTTSGNLGGVSEGGQDMFVAKMKASSGVLDLTFGNGDGKNNDGVLQINANHSSGSNGNDSIQAMTIDSLGNLFVVGTTDGSLGGPNAGGTDGIIMKINKETSLLDTSFGNGDGNDNDGILQINANHSTDATNDETFNSIKVDTTGNIFVAGYSEGSLGGLNTGGRTDGIIVKLSAITGIIDSAFGDGDGNNDDGIVQINNSNTNDALFYDYIYGIEIDPLGNNLFVVGETAGDMGKTSGGQYDAFVIKLNRDSGILDPDFGDGDGVNDDGVLQIGGATDDSFVSIVLDGLGSLFAAGDTSNSLSGPLGGSRDGFIIKINSTSGLVDSTFGNGDGNDNDGIVQINGNNSFDGSEYDEIHFLSMDENGNIYCGGMTAGDLGGTNAGGSDGYIVKLDPTSGTLITSFGNGDGNDNDGILQVNANISEFAYYDDAISTMTSDGSGNLYFGGYSEGNLSEGVSISGNTEGVTFRLTSSGSGF